jgi:hypothetical protein
MTLLWKTFHGRFMDKQHRGLIRIKSKAGKARGNLGERCDENHGEARKRVGKLALQ